MCLKGKELYIYDWLKFTSTHKHTELVLLIQSVWEGLRRPLVARQVVNTTRQEPEIHS